jgi:HNH endonuclease
VGSATSRPVPVLQVAVLEAVMQNDILASLRGLSDAELLARVKDLAAGERDVTAELVAHLAELDTRDVHFREGYASLFAYCRDALTLSEHEAYNRIEVARAARRFPLILEMLADGAVNLTTVRLLAPHLTSDNHRSVLESARGKRKPQVEEIAARLAPRPDIPTFVRKLPASPYAPSLPGPTPTSFPAERALPVAPASPAAPVQPLAPDRYRLQLTIGGETLEKLRLAKDMLRHAIPSGDDALILDRALTALLADLARKKFAAAENPRPSPGTAPGSRHVPADVRRTVWLRDLGRCAFVGENGRRCGERAFVEFHHVKPYAVGGEATPENVQLRCRRHNDYEARVYFAGFDSRGP